MADTLELVVDHSVFILRFLLTWMYNEPQILLTLLITLIVFVFTATQAKKVVVPLLSTPATSLVLSLLLALALFNVAFLSKENLSLQHSLSASRHNVLMSKTHRLSLLQKLQGNEQFIPPVDSRSGDEEDPVNPLDGCLHVYIDLGTNRGVQIRKLYEPHLFPLAPIHELFNRYFGDAGDRTPSDICSVGFEPNPKHEEHLKAMAEAYSSCGVKVLMMTNTGVGASNKKAKFAIINDSYGGEIKHDVGSMFVKDNDTVEEMGKQMKISSSFDEISMIRFSDFLLKTVSTRKLPLKAAVETPRVVVKMDIEGAELEVVPDMFLTGAFRVVDNLHGEWHGCHVPLVDCRLTLQLEKAAKLLGELSQGLEHQFEAISLEDETYSGMPLAGEEVEDPLPTC